MRPTSINCETCGTRVKVARKGKLPSFCKDCRAKRAQVDPEAARRKAAEQAQQHRIEADARVDRLMEMLRKRGDA